MRLPHPSWLTPLFLPALWWGQAGSMAIGRRTGDLVSHVWAIWNGSLGDPTRSELFCWPEGIDLLAIYGGWLHTFVGTGLARLGTTPLIAYSTVVCIWLIVAGIAGIAIARCVALDRGAPWWVAHSFNLTVLCSTTRWTAVRNTLDLASPHWHSQPHWRSGDRVAAGRSPEPGLLGALVFVVSWEHAIWLALACAWLLPWLLRTEPSDGREKHRWLSAAAVCSSRWAPGWCCSSPAHSR